MAYLIHCTDRPGQAALRAATRDEHLLYAERHAERILAAGALLDDDDTPIGSLVLYDTDDHAEARRYADNDPYTRAGLFAAVDIVRWRKVYFDGQRCA